MLRSRLITVVTTFALVGVFSLAAAAETRGDRVQIGRDIFVDSGEKVGDVVCVLCSIRTRGQVAGDMVAIMGKIVLEQGAQAAGDVTSVGGGVRLESGTQVAGGVTAIAGEVRRDPQASIAGDVTDLSGRGWMLLLILAPFLLFGGSLALIIWIIQRVRRPAATPAYPTGTVSPRP